MSADEEQNQKPEETKAVIDLAPEDVQLLANVGFLAISRGLDFHAEAIFNALKKVRPEQDAGYLGHAMVFLARKDCEGALTLLSKRPPSDAVLLFRGMALQQKGDVAEAKVLFSEVLETASGTPFAEVARAFLTLH